ncbi:alpha-keto acid decarboxylase family protein [Sphingosinicella sp. BN140058]|uniref:alpha-keto acid decarboxylase family protein n=1 Tax=Sphingosinicella sp. BN140058 TaxID=1892855 RepID=UPI001010AE02|nr:thiamine pyrophosphate-binding protein [Sphingosinicella sp. BN140058]QAY77447.1 alpha-keto acid decarboxylase family protein [Sphingosinicella sp. BN140058]
MAAAAPAPAAYSVAQYLADRLAQCGLGHVFAVPGDYASHFLDALDGMPGIVRVPNINELGSGYAADGYARFRGIGAACVQYGVGTFSALNCAAGAFVERVPVAFISASPSTKDRALETTESILFHHSTGDLDADRDIFAQVTVASLIVEDPVLAPAQIDAALIAMLSHRRPIYIEVLQDVWVMGCARPQGALAPIEATSDSNALAALVDAAWTRISAAERPVLWAGIDIQRFGLQDLLQRIVDASGLPFTTTSLGKTVLDEAQPQFIGTYAGPASPAGTREAMTRCDCPIALGTIITDDYLDIMGSSFGDMIEVNYEEARVGWAYYPGVALRDFLQNLAERFEADPAFPRRCWAAIAEDDDPEASDAAGPLTYTRFYRQLTDWLKERALLDDIVLVLGESTSLYVFGNLFGLRQNGFVAQAAWGSLGHETGCALGVALGSGKRPFVVAGDGGFMMICQELSSLVRAGIPAAVFVMSNKGYAIEQAFVNIDAFTPQGSFAPFDVLPVWDYLSLAKAFGARGFRVDSRDALADALKDIESLTDVPALIEVVIPEKDLAPQLARLAGAPVPERKYLRTPIPGPTGGD